MIQKTGTVLHIFHKKETKANQNINNNICKTINGAVKKTRTSTVLPTATSTLRVYQFRHNRKIFKVKAHASKYTAPYKTKDLYQDIP